MEINAKMENSESTAVVKNRSNFLVKVIMFPQ